MTLRDKRVPGGSLGQRIYAHIETLLAGEDQDNNVSRIEQGNFYPINVSAGTTTPTVLGATGAAGDYIQGIIVKCVNVNGNNIKLRDGSGGTDITVVANTLHADMVGQPFYLPLNIKSQDGGWYITGGTTAGYVVVGRFT